MLTLEDTRIVADGLDHPECVACHPDGSLWAGGEDGQVYRISTEGKVEEVVNTGGFILGLAISPDLTWMALCDLKKKCLWKLDLASYQLDFYASGVDGHRFTTPNYVSFDSGQNLYVSDSGTFKTVTGKVLKFDRKGEGAVWSNGPFNFSNGIALDPEERFLYVVCSFLPGVERIAINDDGSAGEREVFVTLPEAVPDGIAFDARGNLYISCYAPNVIYKADRNRAVSVLIRDWESHTLCNPTNIAFGGPGFDQLFTANLGRWHITQIDAGIQGLKLACHNQIQ